MEVLRAGKNAVAIHPVQPSEGGRVWPLSSAEPRPFLRALGRAVAEPPGGEEARAGCGAWRADTGSALSRAGPLRARFPAFAHPAHEPRGGKWRHCSGLGIPIAPPWLSWRQSCWFRGRGLPGDSCRGHAQLPHGVI